jgi:hypothetical protein
VWVRLDDGLIDHPKIIAAIAAFKGRGVESAKARIVGTFVIALSYANRHLTDGFVPLSIFCGLEKEKSALERAELFEFDASSGRVRIENYLKWNPSKAEVKAKRARDLARKRPDRILDAVKHSARIPRIPSHPKDQDLKITAPAGAARARAVENSKARTSRTFAQLCVIAKSVLHEKPDADEGDLREILKAQASKAHLRYDGRTAAKAFDAVRAARQQESRR